MRANAVLLLILAIIGLYFLGSGVTGLVVSQSCCFGEACAVENLCPNAVLQSPSSQLGSGSQSFIGVLMLLTTITLYIVYRVKY